MTPADFAGVLGPQLSAALARKGYAELTAVQAAVLEPELEGRDLRITSQTGSGKTVAIGFAIRVLALSPSPALKGIARPRALVVAPTRELARQVEEELSWLYADARTRLAATTGGGSYRDEHRALAAGPAIVVGTPGRLLDHLNRGSIDTSEVGAIVLDEADRMLDLGFREELESILELLPEEHRTHLVSATFPRDVRALADRVQQEAAHVEGTRLGTANADIDHVIHLVEPRAKLDAIVNLLLASPDAPTLVFARTRADVADIAGELAEAGFAVSSLSGEMDQNARNRALAAFKRGDLQALVATDVAARGIDVQDIGRVIHVDTPTNADAYTHRSGRTGRAGRRGTSSLLVAPAHLGQATRILQRAGVPHRLEPIPSAEEIRRAADDRAFEALTGEGEGAPDARATALAARIVEHGDPALALARLLARFTSRVEPRQIRPVSPRPTRATRSEPGPRGGAPRPPPRGDFVTFRVSWGGQHGADTRRLLAMVCRRGGIAGNSVGAIQVEKTFSFVDVAAKDADAFAKAATKPDPRDPRVVIERQAPPHVRPRTQAHTDARQDGPRHAPSHVRPHADAHPAPRHEGPRPASPRSSPRHTPPHPGRHPKRPPRDPKRRPPK